ncbi:TPA: RloB domain-containing protein [Elizabethkingia anophelis]|uniref:RloB family protein n=1 Tax=Elizabethkingia anophelis TaxID=1117645 RepID=UPI001A1F87BA|nr:RloB domain-containing protein [Elizabethkingia anophelis]HAT3999163.1 RloB domain-containing protein [Elizabethkingia anophelis]HAT4010171.1 RloB domain-containing protein [Elizabethkingia anophelis]HAY3502276.1 RloB domain-containing protein [Elizabethkingia anophelis]HAY3509688.1 RloB domain-containing protein [Elizabethkingia anophelis]
MARRGRLRGADVGQIKEPPIRIKHYQYLFLIVCEDQRTEPEYFEFFKNKIPEKSIYLKPVGTGRDPKGVVERAIIEKEELSKEANKEIDEVWVVFDKDDADLNQARIKRFTEAFELADENKIEVAYSNEVFELWLLMHLRDIDHSVVLPRREIYGLLQEEIRKQDKFSDFIYIHGDSEILKIIQEIGSQEEAINRAKELFEKQKDKQPIEANPNTKIHFLVQNLLEWIAYYSYTP